MLTIKNHQKLFHHNSCHIDELINLHKFHWWVLLIFNKLLTWKAYVKCIKIHLEAFLKWILKVFPLKIVIAKFIAQWIQIYRMSYIRTKFSSLPYIILKFFMSYQHLPIHCKPSSGAVFTLKGLTAPLCLGLPEE